MDLLRFTAAFSVMLYHFAYQKSLESPLPPAQLVTKHGYLGVELFFMISGFVILWSAQGRSGWRFVKSRALRLYPEFWVAVPLSALAFTALPGGAGEGITLQSIAANLTMLPQLIGFPYVDGVYWTLFVEMKFYFLVWCLLVSGIIARTETALYVWTTVLLTIAAGAALGPLRSLAMFPFGCYFAAGGLFFLVYKSGWSFNRLAALLACLLLACLQTVEGITGFVADAHATPGAKLANVLVICAMFAVFALISSRTISLRDSNFVALAGRLTYPLYLVHNISKEAILSDRLGLSNAIAIPIAVLVALTLALGVNHVGLKYLQPPLRKALDRVPLR